MNTLFYRNGYLLWISITVLLVAGLSALISLPILEDPRIANRGPIVIASFPGASPNRVEALVTEKLEQALQEVPEIKKLNSSSRAEIATIAIELVDEIGADNNAEVFSKIRDRLAEVELPRGARPPVLDDQRGAVAFTLIASLAWDFDESPNLGLIKRKGEELADLLRTLPGTEIVRIYGEPIEEISIDIDTEQLAALGLSSGAVSRALASSDAKQPAGALRSSGVDLSVEVNGEFDSIARIESTPLMDGERGSVVRLGDIATVDRRWQDPPEDLAIADGERAIFVAARMKPGVRVERWVSQAAELTEDYRSGLNQGVKLEIIFDQASYTRERLGDLVLNLLAGAGVIMLVIFVIMGWRSALIVGSALPLVTGATLFLLLLSGGSLHQMSIFGMIIALGLLIDNAIVIVDEIRKRRSTGKTGLDAVRGTLHHLSAPLLASTLTTVFAFAPIVLLPGNVGDFVGSIGRSVILAILCSFAVALTVIAALAGRYDSVRASDDRQPRKRKFMTDGWHSERLAGLYRRSLESAMRHPIAAVALGVAPAMLGLALAGQLGSQFFPRVDRNMFRAQVWLPPESSLENTRRVADQIDRVIREHPEIQRTDWLIGGSAPSVYYNLVMNQDGAAHYAQATITTNNNESVKPLIRELQDQLDQEFTNAQIVITQFAQGPPIDAPVQFRVYGPSLTTLQEIGERIRLAMHRHPEILHTQVTMPRGKPKLWVDLDEEAVRLAGLSMTDVANQLQENLEGSRGGSVLEGIEEMPVRVRFPYHQRSDFASIQSINIVSPEIDSWIPLSAVGSLVLRPEPGGIGRKDGLRCNTIRGYVTNDALPIEVTNSVLADLDSGEFQLPQGYRVEVGGDSEEESSAVENLKAYVPVLVTLTAATLILVFRSLILASLLGSVALLSVGLGLFATWSFGFPLSFNTILGILGLIGVALNDNIVVLAAIRSNPAAAAGDASVIVDEIVNSTRHILSTTLTTTGGFLPLILAGGDFWPPLAVVIAGGVLGATLIALLYIPAMYLLLKRAQPILANHRFKVTSQSMDRPAIA